MQASPNRARLFGDAFGGHLDSLNESISGDTQCARSLFEAVPCINYLDGSYCVWHCAIYVLTLGVLCASGKRCSDVSVRGR